MQAWELQHILIRNGLTHAEELEDYKERRDREEKVKWEKK